IVPLAQLRAQLQQPREAVGPLESLAPWAREILHLAADACGRETPFQRRACRGDELALRLEAREARQQPVTVHRRVPVEAPPEHGRECPRGAGILVAVQHVRDLVRVFTMDALE